MTLGKNIKKLRLLKGWSQSHLASKCGWRDEKRTKSSKRLYDNGQIRIGCYESDTRKPTPEGILLLAKAFDVSTDELLGEIIKKNKANSIDNKK